MRCLYFIASLALALSANAQTPTSSGAASTQTVQVGFGAHSFEPNNLTANPGDVIVFQFIAQGHTVVQAGFEQPCIPLDTYNRTEPTFFSGWFNGSDVLGDHPPTWNLTVNDTSPVFFYCSRLGSCLNNKMIGSINQNANYSLQAQLDSINPTTGIMLQPGDPIPAESTPTSSATPSKHGVTLSGGAIAGIVVAGVAVLALACALFWFVGRHRTLKQNLDSHHGGAVERWVQSTQPPSSVGGGSSARPPSYATDPTSSFPMDQPKHWEGQSLYAQYMPSPMTPPIQELGVAEPVELDESGRGRARMRDSQEVYRYLIPK